MTRQEHPNISVDCVIFGFDFTQLNVILVERKLTDPDTGEVIIDDLTLAGNHVYVDEPLEKAANRVLFDLTGLKDIYLEQFYTSGDPERLAKEKDQVWLRSIQKNPADRVISVCYFSLIDSSVLKLIEKGRKVSWKPVKEVDNLAFDHKEIMMKAIEALQIKLQNEPIGFELLPPKFTLSQLQKLYEVVFDKEFDKRNFRKKVTKMKYLQKLSEKQKGVSHKPANYFVFRKDIYEKTKTSIINFSI